MSVYMTEEEQIEAIKKWWQRYNGLITVIASIILLVIAGYKYWSWHQDKVTQQASNAYEHMMVAFSNQDNKSVKAYANQLLKEYDSTVYADAARLTLAKLFVDHAKFSKAEEQLQQVAARSKMPALQQVATIRLARILAAKKSYDAALTKLDNIYDSAYLPLIDELKGDIYASNGRYSEAIASYRKALNNEQTHGLGNLFLEMKTNALAAHNQAMHKDKFRQAAV